MICAFGTMYDELNGNALHTNCLFIELAVARTGAETGEGFGLSISISLSARGLVIELALQ